MKKQIPDKKTLISFLLELSYKDKDGHEWYVVIDERAAEALADYFLELLSKS